MGKWCTRCKKFHSINDFYWLPYSKSKTVPRRESWCKFCKMEIASKWSKENLTPEIIRDRKLRKIYGITLADQNRMLEEQDYKCMICEKKLKTWHIDHCHETNRIRSILCGTCNRGLGYFYENPDILETAAAYIRHHSSQEVAHGGK